MSWIEKIKMLGLINNTDWKGIRIDASTHAINTIEYEHHEIHGGSSYSCIYSQAVSDTDDRSIIAFKTPDTTKFLHITISASATAVALASIIEAPAIVDNTGASLTVYNRYRNSSNISTIWDTSQNPDVQGQAMYFTEITMGNVTGGTTIASIPLGAATSPTKSIGGLARAQQEWILLRNTLYAFEVKSLDSSDNTHWIEVDYYEHTNKD